MQQMHSQYSLGHIGTEEHGLSQCKLRGRHTHPDKDLGTFDLHMLNVLDTRHLRYTPACIQYKDFLHSLPYTYKKLLHFFLYNQHLSRKGSDCKPE